MTGSWDFQRGQAAIDAVPADAVGHAFDCLREYHGKTNPWGSRAALISTVGFLRERFGKARCDSEAVADCVRCQTMFLVRKIERMLAASRDAHDADALKARAIIERNEDA